MLHSLTTCSLFQATRWPSSCCVTDGYGAPQSDNVFFISGNTLAIFVLCHRRMWCSTAYLLVILAMYDDVILVLHIYKVFENSPLTPGVKVFQTIAFAPIKWTATTGTIYMTLMVTVERFVAVTSPLRSRIIFSLRAARWLSLVVFIGSIIYNLPHWFAYVYTLDVRAMHSSSAADSLSVFTTPRPSLPPPPPLLFPPPPSLPRFFIYPALLFLRSITVVLRETRQFKQNVHRSRGLSVDSW